MSASRGQCCEKYFAPYRFVFVTAKGFNKCSLKLMTSFLAPSSLQNCTNSVEGVPVRAAFIKVVLQHIDLDLCPDFNTTPTLLNFSNQCCRS